jgi:flavodoxin
MRPNNSLLKTAVNPITTGIINSTGEGERTDVSRDSSIADTGRMDAIKIAESKNAVTWDYEANGNDVVLISPQSPAGHQTTVLEGDAAADFWIALDALEDKYESAAWNIDKETEYRKELDSLIARFFQLMQPTNGKVSKLFFAAIERQGKTASSTAYVTGTVYSGDSLQRFTFSPDRKKAMGLTRIAARELAAQLKERFDVKIKLEKM